MPQELTDDKSTLVQVMAWCHQATSHYLRQCWPRSPMPYGFTRPQWVNVTKTKAILNIKQNFHLPENGTLLWSIYITQIFKQHFPKSTCSVGSFNCPGSLVNGLCWALNQNKNHVYISWNIPYNIVIYAYGKLAIANRIKLVDTWISLTWSFFHTMNDISQIANHRYHIHTIYSIFHKILYGSGHKTGNCGCIVAWFCYQLIAKPGNKTATVPWPDPYARGFNFRLFCYDFIINFTNWCDLFIHIQGIICFTDTRVITWLHQCQWRKPEGCGKKWSVSNYKKGTKTCA